ncbi:hypothetical protein M0813_05931 [Anaeramoeba flamelloides]|uniref:Uncharacterized protein n=1 Tax=Anaeramoeba flamelloides TaxID=1746091 RepID=A0ABQ8XFT4_9EUKA|nr:hypothetical protein M0813_05931 [Anaeramoeba flamelloides]
MHKRPHTFMQKGSIQDAKFVTSSSTTPTAQTPFPNKRQNNCAVTKYMRLIDNQTDPELLHRNYQNQSNQICNIHIPKIDYSGLQSQNHKQEKEHEETEESSSDGNGATEKNEFVSFLFNIQSKKDKKKKKKKKEIENYKNKKINKVQDFKQKWNQKKTKPNQKNSFELTSRKRDLPTNKWESSLNDEQKTFSGVNLLCCGNKITSTVKRRRKNLKTTKPLSQNKKRNGHQKRNKKKKKQRKKKLRKKKKRRKKKKNPKNLKKKKTPQSKRIHVISRIDSTDQENVSSVHRNKPDQKTVRLEKKLGTLACEHNDLQSKVQGLKMEKLQLKNELVQLQLLLKQKQFLDSLSQIKNVNSITHTKPTITKTATAFRSLEREKITTKNNINTKTALPTSNTSSLSTSISMSLSSLSSSLSSSSLSYSCSGSMSGSGSGSGSGSSSQIETPTSEPLINYEIDRTKFIIDNSEEEEEEDLRLSKLQNQNTIEKENATAESEEETCFYWQSLQRKNSKLKRSVDEECPVLIEQILHNKVQISRRSDRLKAKLAILRWLCHLDLYLRMMGEEGLDWNEILYGSSHKREFLRFVHRIQEKVKLNESLALQIYEHDIAISKNLLSNDMIMDNVKTQIQQLNLNGNLYSYLNSGLLQSQNHYNQLSKSENNSFQIIRRSDSESEQTEDNQDNEDLEEDEDLEIFESNVDEEDVDEAEESDNIEEDIDQNIDASLSVGVDVDVDVDVDVNEENEKKDIVNKKNINLEPENSICDPQIESTKIQDFGILINDQDNLSTKDLNSDLIENNNQNQNLKNNDEISSLTFLEKMN